MRNRARLLKGYLLRAESLNGLPVEYIVETTAKCNIYCPMCPRETHKQPKEDMDDHVFETLVLQTAGTAEHMMLIGLGEPLLDPKIFARIRYCDEHGIATLLSTNGTLLDEKASERLLATPSNTSPSASTAPPKKASSSTAKAPNSKKSAKTSSASPK